MSQRSPSGVTSTIERVDHCTNGASPQPDESVWDVVHLCGGLRGAGAKTPG